MTERVRRADAFMMPPSWNAWCVGREHEVESSVRPLAQFAKAGLS
jgi:hypothetical protein